MTYVYLQHHGIKGQRWGVRRYQNADGSLTSAGKKRYDGDSRKELKAKSMQSKVNKRINTFTKNDHKLIDAREKNRERMEAKYDKKIAKAEQNNILKAQSLKEKKASRLRDFDDGTEIIKRGQKVVNEKYSTYLQMKVDSITNPSVKKTAEYKKAGKDYINMMMDYYSYGKDYAILAESTRQADSYGKEKYGDK